MLVLKPELGQSLTPEPVARLMAEMLCPQPHLRLLDAGAGIGGLTQAAVQALCRRSQAERPGVPLQITAYEIDKDLLGPLQQTLDCCHRDCAGAGIQFSN